MELGVVSGTPTQDEYRQFRTAVASDAEMAASTAAYQSAAAKNDNRRMDSLQEVIAKKLQQIDFQYIPAHPHSYLAGFILYTHSLYNPDAGKLATLYKGLDPAIQDSYFGRLTNESIVKAVNIDVGKPAPDFTQTDINGKPVALSSFKGHYVLVDFWASWCGPCRAENPAVLKAYRAYHSKGFDILGVSLDEKKDKWLAAIKKDGLEWRQVSDLKGWENSVAQLYGVLGIPMNYLLDKDGKIIAKSLRGEDLEKTLAELVH
jgi:thiol-disulfide isomerase/thioredoxin